MEAYGSIQFFSLEMCRGPFKYEIEYELLPLFPLLILSIKGFFFTCNYYPHTLFMLITYLGKKKFLGHLSINFEWSYPFYSFEVRKFQKIGIHFEVYKFYSGNLFHKGSSWAIYSNFYHVIFPEIFLFLYAMGGTAHHVMMSVIFI